MFAEMASYEDGARAMYDAEFAEYLRVAEAGGLPPTGHEHRDMVALLPDEELLPPF
jgi:hypothetical protein